MRTSIKIQDWGNLSLGSPSEAEKFLYLFTSKLTPITKALDKIWWGGNSEWRRGKINQKQRNLARAVRDYPRNVRAKINKGNNIIILKYSCPVNFGTGASHIMHVVNCKDYHTSM